MNLAIIDTETIRWSSEISGGFDNLQAFGLTLLAIGIPQSDGTLDYALFPPMLVFHNFQLSISISLVAGKQHLPSNRQTESFRLMAITSIFRFYNRLNLRSKIGDKNRLIC